MASGVETMISFLDAIAEPGSERRHNEPWLRQIGTGSRTRRCMVAERVSEPGAARRTEVAREIAEGSLAHRIGNAIEQAYACGDMIERRRELMKMWTRVCHRDRRRRQDRAAQAACESERRTRRRGWFAATPGSRQLRWSSMSTSDDVPCQDESCQRSGSRSMKTTLGQSTSSLASADLAADVIDSSRASLPGSTRD